MTVKEFYDAVQANGGCQNDDADVWAELDGIQGHLSVEYALGREEKEPFEVSLMLDRNPDHWAWEELFEDWKERHED